MKPWFKPEVESATVSETVSDSGSDDDDTGIVYQGMPSSDDRCDLNCVVSTGEDDQSSNTDSDMNGPDTDSVVGLKCETMATTCFHYRQASSSVSKCG